MDAENRVSLLSTAFRGEPPMLGMLKALSEAMPPPDQATIDVTELQIGEKTISMRAETGGFEEASRIEAALQNSERFKEARKADEKKVGEKVVFNLSIPLGDEEDPS